MRVGKDEAAFGSSGSGCDRCRKRKIPPSTRTITNATITHIQRWRFLPDAGFEGTFRDSSERAGCGVESDILTPFDFFFASHKNVKTHLGIRRAMSSYFKATSTWFIFYCRSRCGVSIRSMLLIPEEVFYTLICPNRRHRMCTGMFVLNLFAMTGL